MLYQYTAETLNKKHHERLERFKEQIERWTKVRDDLSEELELDHAVPDETERSLPQDLVAAIEAAEAVEAAGTLADVMQWLEKIRTLLS